MSWTKIGDEFIDAAEPLSDGAYRTHVDMLILSSRRGDVLLIRVRDVLRFANSDNPQTAMNELLDAGWWETRDDHVFIGLRWPHWQMPPAVVEKRRKDNATRQARTRRHDSGDHGMCDPDRCADLAADADTGEVVTRDVTRDPGRVGTGRVGTGKSASTRSPEQTAPVWPAVATGLETPPALRVAAGLHLVDDLVERDANTGRAAPYDHADDRQGATA